MARHVSTVKIDDDDFFFSEFLEFLEDFRRRRVPRAGDGLVTGLRAGDGSDGHDDGEGEVMPMVVVVVVMVLRGYTYTHGVHV